MRAPFPTAVTSALAIIMTGCDLAPYSLHEDKNGRTIRLNKWNGDVAVVENLTIVKLGRTVEYFGPMSREWPPLTLEPLGDVTATLQTSWHDGMLNYRFSLSPESKKLKDARIQGAPLGRSFTVFLTDTSGVGMVEMLVPLSSMVSIVDDTGKVTALSFHSQVACQFADYLQTSGWNVTWRL